MAAQAAHIAETIMNMKRAIAENQDFSDSEEPYLLPTNRGNKLKRKAYVLEDGLSTRPYKPKVYKRTIEHGGYNRDILMRNPKRYDEDGDELADSDSDEEADARAAEENPYANIHLESLLLPLVSASALPVHPSLSLAYTSPVLTDMAQRACEMTQRERKTLANAKRLMTKLRGDETWIPCGSVCCDNDESIYGTKKLYTEKALQRVSRSVNGFTTQVPVVNAGFKNDNDSCKSSSSGTELGTSTAEANADDDASVVVLQPRNERMPSEAGDVHDRSSKEMQNESNLESNERRSQAPPEEADTAKKQLEDEVVGIANAKTFRTEEPQQHEIVQQDAEKSFAQPEEAHSRTNVNTQPQIIGVRNDTRTVLANENLSSNHLPTPDSENNGTEESNEAQETSRAAPRRMRTRAQAQAASEPTASTRNESPESWAQPEIHSLFKLPETAIPDGDLGMPVLEAEETRRLFTMYIQRQEEICRGAEKLYDGLLQADRERMEVFKWCKAEGHVGELSDGEDWYDKEEWGLEEDLEKGHNDEDGDTNAIQVSAVAIAFNPTFWNIVARSEYHNKTLTRLFNGNSLRGCYALALTIFSIGLFRDALYERALRHQPISPLFLQPYIAYLLLALGNTLVLTSYYALGITGTFLGDYFGILMDEPVTGFPFNITGAPMYWGSTMSFLGTALLYGRPAGVLLTAEVLFVYSVALQWEDPFTAEIYRKRDREKAEERKKTK